MSKTLLWRLAFLTAALQVGGLSACNAQFAALKIGFVAGLTGQNAALGVDGRDGALLAVQEINKAGGAYGRQLELLVRDDLATKEGALAADRELIETQHAPVIIGHMTSGAMMSVWEELKDSAVIFISPTVSTPQLEGIQDNFFRLIVVNSFVAKRLASYALELGLKKIAIFYDTDNAAFTDTYRQSFVEAFTRGGGETVFTRGFSSQAAPDFKASLQELKDKSPDGIFIIASAFDAAVIAQQARLLEINTQLLSTNWALTDDLLRHGGESVDNLLTVVSHSESNTSPEYIAFEQKFIQRYRRKPTFAAGYGYEAVYVLAEALRISKGSVQDLASALPQIKNFSGVHGSLTFDKYGDVSRSLYLITVKEGQFQTIETFPAP